MGRSGPDQRRTARASRVAPDVSPLPFDYDEFAAWYSDCRRSLLEPARVTFARLLDEQLRQSVPELDRHRMRVASSRVKEPLRVWAKLQKDTYRANVGVLGDIPALIDDLVGLRIVCNNLSDIRTVQEILGTLPTSESVEPFGLATEPGSPRAYHADPKPSGYRAFHVNLVTHVPGLVGLDTVRAELQIRTLLQDGWGELTHEDTYKPGVILPPLVTTLARRMADLLSTVDDLAQDLREELDRLAQSAVDGTNAAVPDEPTVAEPELLHVETREQYRELVVAETARIVDGLTGPSSLASIAAVLQGLFGTAIRNDWAGHKTFKALLLAAVPSINIVSVGPGYVVPAGAVPNPGWPRPLLDVLP
jgi:ppGpp synthetase/RelA/SpoT-type nucleotidyltranferase